MNLLRLNRQVNAYHNARVMDMSCVSAWEELRKDTLVQFEHVSKQVTVWYVNYEPYRDAFSMWSDIVKHKQLLVSNLHNEHPWFTSEDNLKFRAVHDWYHFTTGEDFSLEGELAVYRAHADSIPSARARRALYTEVVIQAAYKCLVGEFPIQKLFIPTGV